MMAVSENDKNNNKTEKNQNEIVIVLEDFAHPVQQWRTLNDPVMGGRSTSSLTIANGVAHFQGHCNIVPSLQAPGFITMVTGGFGQPTAHFPDVSPCTGLQLVLRSPTAFDYTGYYLSFGNVHLPDGRFAMGYKTHLDNIPASFDEEEEEEIGGDFGQIRLPFSSFSSKWDDATGKTLVPCSPQTPQYCPDLITLQDLKTLSIWGEGVEGAVDLEIQSIGAYGCASHDVITTTTTTSTTSVVAPLPWMEMETKTPTGHVSQVENHNNNIPNQMVLQPKMEEHETSNMSWFYDSVGSQYGGVVLLFTVLVIVMAVLSYLGNHKKEDNHHHHKHNNSSKTTVQLGIASSKTKTTDRNCFDYMKIESQMASQDALDQKGHKQQQHLGEMI